MPRFTILRILILTAICGCIFAIGRFAVQGEAWAVAIIGSVMFLVVVMIAYAFAFVLVVVAERRMKRFKRWFGIKPKTESPFATDKLPPQIIAPVDPD